MGNPAGVRRDFQALEQRRLLGARLLQQGVPQAEVARRVGVHRQSVSRWAQQLQRGGQRALKKAGRAGRRPRLRPEDLRRIERGLKRGPQALGYETSLWTSWRVAHLIEEECGVRYHTSQAWRILRQLGWSCQRPVGRALERDEAKIRRRKQERWPELKKRPKPKGEPSRIFQPLLACCSEQARPAPPLVRARDPVVSSSGASTCGRPALRTTMFRSASLETTVSGGRFPTLKQSVDTRW